MSSSLQAAMDMGILASSEPRPTMTTLPPATQARMPVCSSMQTTSQQVAGSLCVQLLQWRQVNSSSAD